MPLDPTIAMGGDVEPLLAGRYRLLERLGEGGVGVVYRAWDENLQTEVAVKFLRLPDAGQLARMRREAQALARLDHPSIVRVFDLRADHEPPYLVMALVPGRPLSDAKLPIPNARVRAILDSVLDALRVAHAEGVIHRDVKPSNILERPDGRIVVTDFGLAAMTSSDRSLTGSGMLLGTPEYWAPEQASGRPVTEASDLYALGAVAFELLCGRRIFPVERGGDRIATSMRRVVEDAPAVAAAAPSVARDDPGLAALVDSFLKRDPGARPSIDEALRRLRSSPVGVAVLETSVPSTVSASALPPARAPVDRAHVGRQVTVAGAAASAPVAGRSVARRVAPVAAGLAGLIAAVAVFLYLIDHSTPDSEADSAAGTTTGNSTAAAGSGIPAAEAARTDRLTAAEAVAMSSGNATTSAPPAATTTVTDVPATSVAPAGDAAVSTASAATPARKAVAIRLTGVPRTVASPAARFTATAVLRAKGGDGTPRGECLFDRKLPGEDFKRQVIVGTVRGRCTAELEVGAADGARAAFRVRFAPGAAWATAASGVVTTLVDVPAPVVQTSSGGGTSGGGGGGGGSEPPPPVTIG